MKYPLFRVGVVLLAMQGLISCQKTESAFVDYQKTAEEPYLMTYAVNTARTKYNQPLPDLKDLNLNSEKVALGNMLYHDTRLSGNGKLTCASCHGLAIGGDDNMPVALGINGQLGPINTPTVLNSGFNFKQFWDGRAANLRNQAEGPVANPGEMGAEWPQVVKNIQAVKTYQNLFGNLYPEQGISVYTITDAIAEFERSLITPAPIDAYLKGNDNALSANQAKGYQLFQSYGCVACHQGVNFGGNMMQKFGALEAYFSEKNERQVDKGLFNLTKKETDKNVFKVPSLRNIEVTGPYFHNAGAKTLDDAIKIMGLNQLGRKIPDKDRALIADFLTSLTGKLETQAMLPPKE
ncbi:cytochrome-c peroxidase [Thiosulfativibrio zosterae]|uniref:Cytochrome c biogenesis protein CcsA n=1 Tax=Thiosulfativibrio zosterae TaxID=2675053 RepID=A0A6F8PJM4_9GAMM|nr:cytochrome c peroxidase [Thiosulfativibrio zosterae]BBP42311.1 cytochrome c biogenesis protein CcsA [Thiosulfativibrio zosterae]